MQQMVRVKVESKKAQSGLAKYANETKALPLIYAETIAKKGYRICSKILKQLYALPRSRSWSQKLERPGVRQVLERKRDTYSEGAAFQVCASTQPLSLIRFVEGDKIIPRSSSSKNKRLKIDGVFGKSWNVKSSFSAYGKNKNLHVFLRRTSHKAKMEVQKFPSAFELLSKEHPQAKINKVLGAL